MIDISIVTLIVFYFTVAACEIFSPDQCLTIFEKLVSNTKKIRLLSLAALAIAFLYYTAAPTRLQWLITTLFWIYLASGIWFAVHPQSFSSLCHKGFLNMPPAEKRTVLYSDCAIRALLALLLICAM